MELRKEFSLLKARSKDGQALETASRLSNFSLLQTSGKYTHVYMYYKYLYEGRSKYDRSGKRLDFWRKDHRGRNTSSEVDATETERLCREDKNQLHSDKPPAEYQLRGAQSHPYPEHQWFEEQHLKSILVWIWSCTIASVCITLTYIYKHS